MQCRDAIEGKLGAARKRVKIDVGRVSNGE